MNTSVPRGKNKITPTSLASPRLRTSVPYLAQIPERPHGASTGGKSWRQATLVNNANLNLNSRKSRQEACALCQCLCLGNIEAIHNLNHNRFNSAANTTADRIEFFLAHSYSYSYSSSSQSPSMTLGLRSFYIISVSKSCSFFSTRGKTLCSKQSYLPMR